MTTFYITSNILVKIIELLFLAISLITIPTMNYYVSIIWLKETRKCDTTFMYYIICKIPSIKIFTFKMLCNMFIFWDKFRNKRAEHALYATYLTYFNILYATYLTYNYLLYRAYILYATYLTQNSELIVLHRESYNIFLDTKCDIP